MSDKQTFFQDFRRESIRNSARNPGAAALMSFFIMGLGQVYAGHIDKGIILLSVQLAGFFSFYSLYTHGIVYEFLFPFMGAALIAVGYYFFAVFGVLIWIYNIKDAYYASLMSAARDWFEVERVLLPILTEYDANPVKMLEQKGPEGQNPENDDAILIEQQSVEANVDTKVAYADKSKADNLDARLKQTYSFGTIWLYAFCSLIVLAVFLTSNFQDDASYNAHEDQTAVYFSTNAPIQFKSSDTSGIISQVANKHEIEKLDLVSDDFFMFVEDQLSAVSSQIISFRDNFAFFIDPLLSARFSKENSSVKVVDKILYDKAQSNNKESVGQPVLIVQGQSKSSRIVEVSSSVHASGKELKPYIEPRLSNSYEIGAMGETLSKQNVTKKSDNKYIASVNNPSVTGKNNKNEKLNDTKGKVHDSPDSSDGLLYVSNDITQMEQPSEVCLKEKGFSEYIQGNWKAALPYYLEYMKNNDAPELYETIAFIFERLEMPLAAYEASEEFYLKGLESRNNIIRLARLALELDKPSEAKKYSQLALESSPDRVDIKLMYAKSLIMNKKYDSALVVLNGLVDDSSNSYLVKSRAEKIIEQISHPRTN